MTAVEQYDTANWGYDSSRTVRHCKLRIWQQ